MDPRRSRRLILTAAVAGLILRLAFSFFYWSGKPLTHDEHEYLALAQSLSQGDGLRYPPGYDSGTAPQFGRAPGYPAFLVMIGGAGSTVDQSNPARIKLAQGLLGALSVLMIGGIALRAAGERAGVVAAALAAVYPPLVWISSYVLSESLFIPLALGCVMVLHAARVRADAERSPRGGGALTVAAGLLAGAAVLVRPGMLFFLPIAAL